MTSSCIHLLTRKLYRDTTSRLNEILCHYNEIAFCWNDMSITSWQHAIFAASIEWNPKTKPLANPYFQLENAICNMSVMMTSSNGNIFRVTGPLCGWVNNREAGDLRCHRGHCWGWSPWLYFRVCIFGFCMSFPFTEDGAIALSPSMAMTVSVLCRRLSFNSLRANDAYMCRKNDQD